jgi:DNA replication licensing factor MCM2
VRISGVVTRRSPVFPQLKLVTFDCDKCGATNGPFAVSGATPRPLTCVDCQSRGPFTVSQDRVRAATLKQLS